LDKETKVSLGKMYHSLELRITRLETAVNKLIAWVKEFEDLNK